MKQKHIPSTLALALLLFATLMFGLVIAPGRSFSARLEPQQDRQLVQGAPVTAWPSKAKRWALVIGVDQYRDENISRLRGAANDAHSLAEALVRYAGFPADQVILLATDQSEGRQPTRINILTYLSNLASAVPKDGLLLVSFAGHGIERGRQAYLIPSDARLTDDVSLLEESAVSVTRMHDRIRATGVGQVVVLLDACRNDPGGRAEAPNPLTTAYTNAFDFDVRNHEVTAFVTIYATAVGQRAYEYADKKQGYFTWSLIEGLKGGAANEKGEVTLANLVKYVQENVPKHVTIDLGAGKQQRPFYQMEGYRAEQLVIAVSNPATAGGPPATAVDPAAIELSYWDSIKTSTDVEDFKGYLAKYPNGQFVALAHNKVRQLEALGDNSVGRVADVKGTTTLPVSPTAPNLPAGTPDNRGAVPSIPAGAKVFSVKNGYKRKKGELVVSPQGLIFREEGGQDDFNIPCSSIKALSINTSWGSTEWHKLFIQYSFNGFEKGVNLGGKNNTEMRDAILEACAMKRK